MSSSDNSSPRPSGIRSMTGYAQTRKQTSAGELTFSLRSVNHRGLDLHFHLNAEFAPYEAGIRALLKEGVGRGHLEIRASLARESNGVSVSINREALRRYAAAFREASLELQIASEPDLNVLLGLPGVFTGALNGAPEAKPLGPDFTAELLDAAAACIRDLNECREREGRELAAIISRELTEIENATQEILSLRTEALEFFHRRLRERLSEMLGAAFSSDGRLAEEAALLADRSDVHEELTRLEVHAREMRRILENGGPIGKPLDFLLQEMNRETNTTVSKSSGAGDPGLKITNLALGLKANIERLREQALNLESRRREQLRRGRNFPFRGHGIGLSQRTHDDSFHHFGPVGLGKIHASGQADGRR
jgi:uncharacterized protein (TIGR00255 family)